MSSSYESGQDGGTPNGGQQNAFDHTGSNHSGSNNSGSNNSGSNHQDQRLEHFDEVDAVRRFPSEDSWLDLPLPDLGEDQAEHASDGSTQKQGTADLASSQAARSFADRVLRARQDDLELDAKIAELDRVLTTHQLQQHAVPATSNTFVETTVAKVMEERRQRWQQMLSRHVAPEPSNEFVSRTLAALQQDSKQQVAATSKAAASSPRSAENPLRLGAPPLARRSQNWPVFTLLAAAAAAMLWLFVNDEARAPLELRLAKQVSPAAAYGESTSPMSAILARVAHDEEPFAAFDEPADGLWLSNQAGAVR
jgi:hypothetical protein